MSKKFLAATVFALVAGAFVSAQQAYKAPRTPWGDPDLERRLQQRRRDGDADGAAGCIRRPAHRGHHPGRARRAQQAAYRAVQRRCGRHGVRRRSASTDPFDLRLVRAEEQPSVVCHRSAGRQDSGAHSRRAAARSPSAARRQHERESGRAVQQLRRHGALRSLHHARHSELDDAGRLRQQLRDRARPGLRRDPLRDDSRDARHSARRPSARAARTSGSTWATPAATGKATRLSWRRRTSPTAASIAAEVRT